MQFLLDMELESETITNISVAEDHDPEFNDSNSSFDSNSSHGSCNNKRRHSDTILDYEETIERLADALSQPVRVNFSSITPPPPDDKFDLFGKLIAAQLRDVQPQFVDNIMLQVLQIINTTKRQKL